MPQRLQGGTGTGCVSAAKTLNIKGGDLLARHPPLCFCTSKALVQWESLLGSTGSRFICPGNGKLLEAAADELV